VTVSSDPGRRQPRKRARKKRANPTKLGAIVTRFRRHIDDRWPNLGQHLASFMKVSREKLDDIYSSAAQVVTERKEAFEDRLAEKKAQARAATRAGQQKSTPARPVRRRVRDTVKDRTVQDAGKRSVSRLPSRKPPRSSGKPRS
jgi:hypothetical protein